MGKIGVHLKNKLIIFLYRPFKPMNISGAQTKFSGSDFKEKFIRKFLL